MRASRLIRGSVIAIVLAWPFAAAIAKEPVANLSKCPAWGSEERGSTRGLLNEVKHNVPTGTPVVLDFPDIVALQKEGDARVKSGPNARVSAADRQKLHGLSANGKQAGEGDLVTIGGFVAGKAYANVGESANCYLHGPSNNDFEFWLAPTAKAAPTEGIVGEMIPQSRPKNWTLGRLRVLAEQGREVRVTGQLMFDTRHKVNVKSVSKEAARVSTWEIHPVTKFLVCSKGTGCDPAKDADWQPLEAMAEK